MVATLWRSAMIALAFCIWSCTAITNFEPSERRDADADVDSSRDAESDGDGALDADDDVSDGDTDTDGDSDVDDGRRDCTFEFGEGLLTTVPGLDPLLTRVGDVDNDGIRELIVGVRNPESKLIVYQRPEEPGPMLYAESLEIGFPTGSTLSDFDSTSVDRDESQELIVFLETEADSGDVQIFSHDPDEGYQLRLINVFVEPNRGDIGNIDGVGNPDIAAHGTRNDDSENYLMVWRLTETLGVERRIEYSVESEIRALRVVDLDSDDSDKILTIQSAPERLVVYALSDDIERIVELDSLEIEECGSSVLEIVDLDGDGADEVLHLCENGDLYLLDRTAGDVLRSRLLFFRLGEGVVDLAIGDLNADGQAEIVVRKSEQIEIYCAPEEDYELSRSIDIDSSTAGFVELLDGNGDDILDIVGISSSVAVYPNQL